MNGPDDFVIGLLLEDGRITPTQMADAQRQSLATKSTTLDTLVSAKKISSRDIALARATVSEVPFADLDHFDIDVQVASVLPRSLVDKSQCLPIFQLAAATTLAMVDPLDLAAIDRVRSILRTDITPVLVEPLQLRALTERVYSLVGTRSAKAAGSKPVANTSDVPRGVNQDPIVAAVNQIIAGAIDDHASDIHLSPDETELYVRYRIDGMLHARQGPPLSNHAALVQRLKVMSNLDLTQSRRPQDGKFRFVHGDRPVDVRVSMIPTVCGENVVLRLLVGSTSVRGVRDLDFAPEVEPVFSEIVQRAQGMLLVTGPTGSGKTTTLYTALREVNTPERHCVTIEDPVEIRLPMVRHVQVNTEIGLTFATALRSILRQDPDVVLVGEIRDEETARIAVQAALTGHMVLSTLHTNDAPGAIARLMDFNCPSFAINAALTGVLAQRLVRRVCAGCAKASTPEPALLARFCPRDSTGQFRIGAGCPQCGGSGYRGRMGVYELMPMTAGLRGAIEKQASSALLRRLALNEGMKPLWQDGVEKARTGRTTLAEVARIAAGVEYEDRCAQSAVATSSTSEAVPDVDAMLIVAGVPAGDEGATGMRRVA